MITPSNILVGIIGLPGVGKSTLAKILCEILTEKGIRTERYKVSDWMKAHLLVKSIPISRISVIQVSSEMINEYGENFWAEKILRDLSDQSNVVVKILETGWSFNEMFYIKSKLQHNCILLYIDAPINNVISHINNRTPCDKKVAENDHLRKVIDNFNLSDISSRADAVIENGGTIEMLYKQGMMLSNDIFRFLSKSSGEKALHYEWVRIVIVNGNNILLMRRRHWDDEYYLFPGGRVELGEKIEQACIREAKEETGLDIVLGKKLCILELPGRTEHYFYSNVFRGTLGIGQPEADRQTIFNQYFLEWVNIDDFYKLKIMPDKIKHKLEFLSSFTVSE